MTLKTAGGNMLREQVENAISNSPYFNHRGLQFEAHQGHVSLKGRVESFYQKQMAQEALRGIEGIKRIQNDLEVVWANA